MLIIDGNSSIDGPTGVSGYTGYNHAALAVLDAASSSPLNPMFMVSGIGKVSVGTNQSLGAKAQLDLMQNNTWLDYLLRVGKYNGTTEKDWFGVDNNGFVGIGQLNSSTNLLQVSDINNIGATNIIEVDHDLLTTGTLSNYFVARINGTGEFPSHVDFEVNNVGQVGVGSTAQGAHTDLFIQDHGYPGASNLLNTNGFIAAQDEVK